MISQRLRLGVFLSGGVFMCSAVLTGCSPGPVHVDAATLTSPVSQQQCTDLINALPDTVLGQDRREVEPSDAQAAAWGDPAIVLRCGIDKPAALRRTSKCFVADDVGWLVTQNGKPIQLNGPPVGQVEFTTIGRSVYVELTIPGDWTPPGDATVDVAAAISSTTDDVKPCQ